MTSILIIDRDLGFMWALAEGLKIRGIATIPATSVEEAETVLSAIRADLSLLIMNCACERVCSFAQQLRKEHRYIQVIGIVSPGRRCRACERLMIATLSDPEDRSPGRLRHCIELVCILTGRSGFGGSWSG
jgi:DNA-binding NtrC family response regulator